jgi:hypothetical protein
MMNGSRGCGRRVGCFLLLFVGSVAQSACSNGKGTPVAGGGAAGAPAGVAGGSGTSGVAGAGGTAGAGGSGATAGVGGAGAGGSTTFDAGTAGSGADAAAGGDGAVAIDVGGAGGSKSCTGNVLSLSANGTGTDSDAARARLVLDLMTDLPIGNANRTIEFWADIKPTDWVGEKNEIYVYGDLGTTAAAFGLDFGTFAVNGMATNHATLNPVTGGGFNDDSRNDLGLTSAVRQWVHIAMTWDGTVIKTYVDGALKITSPGTGGVTKLATASSVVTVGCNPPYYGCFNGSYDELRIWKTARSDAEISSNYDKTVATDAEGLVGYWKFDEEPGATMAADSVTTAEHTAHPGMLASATAAGLPTFITPTTPSPVHCR